VQGSCPATQPVHVPEKPHTIPLQHSVSTSHVAPTEPQHAVFVHGWQT
jgi:hypothetical protein